MVSRFCLLGVFQCSLNDIPSVNPGYRSRELHGGVRMIRVTQICLYWSSYIPMDLDSDR